MPDMETNPYYPYRKILQGANTLRGAELIPHKILTYLLDLPDAAGHVPFESNDNPRARLMRYLWNDGANPLSQALPTPQEKLSMLYDPEHPDAANTDEEKQAHPKGYRLFAQRNINSSIIEAKSMLKIYTGRVIDDSDFMTVITLNAEIWTNCNLVTNTKTNAYDRTWDMEQCIREALAGVNIDGIGTVTFARQNGSYNGSEILYTDGSETGRILYFSILWAEGPQQKTVQGW